MKWDTFSEPFRLAMETMVQTFNITKRMEERRFLFYYVLKNNLSSTIFCPNGVVFSIISNITTTPLYPHLSHFQLPSLSINLPNFTLSSSKISRHDIFQVFKANVDNNSMVMNYFTPSIDARYIRIHPLSFNSRPILKMELADCIIRKYCA